MAYLSQCQPGFSAFWRQIPLGQKRSLSPISGDAGGRPPPSDQSPSASQFRRPMAEPQPKRPKVSRDKEDYKPGNIIAIEVRNFMTFGSVIQCPGPRLNLLIGPNGSGKSSLVCAIALGLGGDPQVLGRATSVGAYVKRGEESGYIKITLRGNNDDNITIMRKIDIHNKSEWVLNGKVVPKRDVTETIQRFNIQVNNLTQFLPQDRVCEFAKLTPVQLLEETEKAVGDPQLPVLHQSLVNKSQELKTLERAVETNRVSLQQLKEQNVVLEKDVERVRQRDELLLQVESMKNKLPWLQYDIKKKEYLDAQELEKEAKGKLNEAAKVTHELKKPIETLKQEKRVLDNKCKKATEYLEGNAKKRSDIVEEDNSLAVKVQGKYNDMEELKTQEESHQQKIAQTKEKFNAAEYELHNLPPFEHPKDILDGLISQINELDKTAREIKSDKMSKEKERAYHRNNLDQCIDRLKKMENTSHKGLQALRNAGAHKIFEAYHWVQDHRQHFKKEVYGPVLLEVNVPNRVHADFLEGQVGFYMWKAFVTQDPRDRDYLYENLRSFDVPILNHVGDEGHERARFQVTDEMKELGVYSKLDEVFDAPRAVKEVLISQFGLEDSYIGTQKTDQRASDVQGLGIMSLWTPDNCYKWNRSRYSNNVSASVNSVQPARLLLCNADVREIDSLKSKITGYENTVSSLGKNIETLQSETTRLENHAATLRKEREEILYRIQNEKKKRQEKESHVRQWKLRLENLEKQEKLDDALAKLTEEVDRLKTLRFKLVSEKLKTLLNQAVIHRRDLTEKTMALIELEHKIKELEANMKHEEKLAMEASMQYEACKKKAENCRDQLSEAKRHAESIAKLTPELKKAFLELPSTIEDLEAAIHDTTSQANSLLCFNPNVLAQYESRLVKIDALAKKLEADEKDLASHLEDISSLKGRWLSTLKDLVIQINKTFSCNFQEMAVAGEVSLDERGTDFAQYGILIKVKFRQAGQLQVLSSQHQSGGERSVATILYLVSLQDLTNCPFRVVDEINQGMDPVNERKMFQQLVRAASKPNTPQCFLVTPKLLPNLEYSEAVTALTVMNGPWIEQPSKVWSCGKSWGYVTGLQRESTAENGQ